MNNQKSNHELKPSDLAWCKTHFNQIKVGGTWGVPRSGLLFTRTKTGFDLNHRIPFIPEMADAAAEGKDVPPTAKELLEYQRSDFACMFRHFTAAGMTFGDSRNLLNPVTESRDNGR